MQYLEEEGIKFETDLEVSEIIALFETQKKEYEAVKQEVSELDTIQPTIDRSRH